MNQHASTASVRLRIFLATLLALSSLMSYAPALHAQKEVPVPVTVKSSFFQIECTSVSQGSSICDPVLHIRAEIQGQELELIAQGRPALKRAQSALLVPGEYKAVLAKSETGKPYLSDQAYDFEFPDGDRQHFVVIGRSAK